MHSRISDLFSVVKNGANIRQNKIPVGIPITRIETIAQMKVDLDKVGYANITDDTYKDYYLKNGDILMSHINSVSHLGKVALVSSIKEKVIHGMNLLCLRANERLINSIYVFHFFKSSLFRSRIKRITKKSVNQASFNITNLKKIKIPLPPLKEQKRIAAVLTRAEALIAKRKESIRLLDELVKSTFNQQFVQSDFPQERLEMLTTKITDGEHKKPEYIENGVPFVSVKNITTGKLVFEDCKFISNNDYEKFTKRCNPEIDDILYTKVGATYGRSCIVDIDIPFSLYVSVALLKPEKTKINPHFLNVVMNTPYIKRQADRSIKGAGVPDLHLIEIKSFKIPVPPLSLQNQFASFVRKVEAIKSRYQQSLEELENLYGSLSQRSFRGELS